MYNTQVSFTTRPELKKLALAKAKQEGLPLKTVLVYALKGFVAGTITFGLNTPESDVEKIDFEDTAIKAKAIQLAKLLK